MAFTATPNPTIRHAGFIRGLPFFEISPLIGSDFSIHYSRGYEVYGFDVSEIPSANKVIPDYNESRIPILRLQSSSVNTLFGPRIEKNGKPRYWIFGIRVRYTELGNNPDNKYYHWIVSYLPTGLTISTRADSDSYTAFKTAVRTAANAYYDAQRPENPEIMLPDTTTLISINNYRLHNNFPDTFGLLFNVDLIQNNQYKIRVSTTAGNVYSLASLVPVSAYWYDLTSETKPNSRSGINSNSAAGYSVENTNNPQTITIPRDTSSSYGNRNRAVAIRFRVISTGSPNSFIYVGMFMVNIGDKMIITDIFWNIGANYDFVKFHNLWEEYHEEAIDSDAVLNTQDSGSPNLLGIVNPNDAESKYGEFFIGAASSPNPELLEFPTSIFYEPKRISGSITFEGGLAPHAEGNNKTGVRFSFQPKTPQNAPQMFLPPNLMGSYYIDETAGYFVRYINVKKTQSDIFDNVVWNAKGFDYRHAETTGLPICHEEENQGTYGNVIRAYTLYYNHQISGNPSQKVTVFVDTTITGNQIIYVIYDIRNDNIPAVLGALAAYHNAQVPSSAGEITLPDIEEDIILPDAEDIPIENTEETAAPTQILPVSIKNVTDTDVTFYIGKAPENQEILNRTLFFLRTLSPRGRSRRLIQSKLIPNNTTELTIPLTIFPQGLYKIYQRGYDTRGDYVESPPVNWRKGESTTVFPNDFSDEGQGTPNNPGEISDIFDYSEVENIPILSGKCKEGVETIRELVSF